MDGIVVTGRGIVSSVANGADEFFDALLGMRSGITDDGVAPCAEFEAETVMTAKEARRNDRFTQLAVGAADEAAAEAGLMGDVEPSRVGVIVGTGVGGLTTLQKECQVWLEEGDRAVSPLFVPMMMPNAAAGQVAMRLGAHGPGFSVASACATGAHAIGEAKRMIERNEVDVVIAGGTEAALVGLCLAAFRRMGALSREGVSRPFDVNRDGFVMGEGAAVLVLEREAHATARGAKILGRVTGYGASNDAFHITQPEENGRGAIEAMTAALRDADLSPSDVGYVNAHGTSTPFNDRIEAQAIRQVLGEDGPPVSSCKGAIGHTLGAAGAIEALACVEALRRGALPPTLGLEEVDPECEADHVAGAPREAPDLKVALSNSFGFGGQNATLVLQAA
ncbi:MAG: beta-ketoacyl-[acyl-carrier-protein] synthase family protein [Conexibacter sp.]|jgi:3-oxoacyl-[acyl-carrier-protein] synthase II|nr:beta-ketoacyl-[acyl-carrier-protein] synthase family protein [Conexibacter sp.]MCZ4493987.1 beta-ketoacyl-[acyl-carrier-protein] synthase family protein [Conexibacter sp.]MDX6714154.1 3-oxoacyl-[acyl-carrier-protein] synthase [Baekduia sp.]MDX6732413.1 3-oxoacyl-[acyl-carrier-protein] synthase [Baekduia sp.]